MQHNGHDFDKEFEANRLMIAAMAMQGILSNSYRSGPASWAVAEKAFEHADALLNRYAEILDEEEENENDQGEE